VAALNLSDRPTRDDSLARRLAQLARSASTEIAPHDEGLLPVIRDKLAPGSTLYIAHTPKATLEDVIRVALRAQSLGFRASPHIVARRLTSHRELRDALRELREGGVEQILLVAGDLERPAGPFKSTLDVIAGDMVANAGMPAVAFGAHPEGHKAIGPTVLMNALQAKQEFARQTGIRVHIVTQFGFNPAAICAWGARLAANGIRLPIHVGVVGPAPLPKVIKFAMQCGVRSSLGALIRNMSALSAPEHLAIHPDEMLCGLVRGFAATPMNLERVHFYTFGGAVATASWLRAVGEGRFELLPDGARFSLSD